MSRIFFSQIKMVLDGFMIHCMLGQVWAIYCENISAKMKSYLLSTHSCPEAYLESGQAHTPLLHSALVNRHSVPLPHCCPLTFSANKDTSSYKIGLYRLLRHDYTYTHYTKHPLVYKLKSHGHAGNEGFRHCKINECTHGQTERAKHLIKHWSTSPNLGLKDTLKSTI